MSAARAPARRLPVNFGYCSVFFLLVLAAALVFRGACFTGGCAGFPLAKSWALFISVTLVPGGLALAVGLVNSLFFKYTTVRNIAGLVLVGLGLFLVGVELFMETGRG